MRRGNLILFFMTNIEHIDSVEIEIPKGYEIESLPKRLISKQDLANIQAK